MDYTFAYVMMIIATILILFWSFLFFKYFKKYDYLIVAVDKKKFPLPELFFIGLGCVDLFHINLKNERGIKKQRKIAEVYGSKYAEFYHRTMLGAQITYALTVAPLGFLVGAMANEIIIALLAIAASVALIVYFDMDVNNAISKRRDEMLSDLPNVISKLALFVNAGLPVREAWRKVAMSSDGVLYKEMRITMDDINNAKTTEMQAYQDFAQRCAIKEIKKFTLMLVQSMNKTAAELAMNLRYMSEESWEEKKHRAKRKGELANTKLMIPIMIMFVGILMVIIVPIMSNVL